MDTSSSLQAAQVSEDEIRKLWRNPAFSGSFSGIANFQSCLEMEKNIKMSKHRLFAILRKDPEYLLDARKKSKTFPRRRLFVHGVGQVWQADLAIMFPMENYIGFLLCIDLFSRAIYCQLIKKKDRVSIRNAFQKIFKQSKLVPAKLETDQGQEFLSNKLFFNEKKIFFKIKTGRNKAAFAERAIRTVKHRLFRLLRTLLSKDWPKYLPQVVAAINNSPSRAIGGLRPAYIKGPLDDPKVDEAIGIPEDTSFKDQLDNQKTYEKKKNLIQKGDFVYADFGPTAFEKGFDSPNYQIYEVAQVDAGKTPPLFKLIDLAGAKVPGNFYPQQLTKTKAPTPRTTFRIEKVLKTRKRKGKKEVLVKYLHYPAKFNQWLVESTIVEEK